LVYTETWDGDDSERPHIDKPEVDTRNRETYNDIRVELEIIRKKGLTSDKSDSEALTSAGGALTELIRRIVNTMNMISFTRRQTRSDRFIENYDLGWIRKVKAKGHIIDEEGPLVFRSHVKDHKLKPMGTKAMTELDSADFV
jgi:hypothetical protein